MGFRARTWFWYWLVRRISKWSDAQLDTKAFGDVRRKRHFERIQHSASSPDDVALFEGKTLLEAVDEWILPDNYAAAPFAFATAAYRSPLWDFLTRRDFKPGDYTLFIERAVATRGWHRVHLRDFGFYRALLGEAEPAIEAPEGMAYSAMLHKLANEATPDSLALLIALFREAIHAVRLRDALLIQPAITATVGWMCHRLQMPETITRLLDRLVDDRVLANIWLTEADWREQIGGQAGVPRNSRERLRQFRAWVTWYVDEFPRTSRANYSSFPIVPASPRIAWIEANRASLLEAYQTMRRNEADSEYQLFAKFSTGEERRIDQSEWGLRLAEAMGCPPEESPRLYSERPALELGRLPRAY